MNVNREGKEWRERERERERWWGKEEKSYRQNAKSKDIQIEEMLI